MRPYRGNINAFQNNYVSLTIAGGTGTLQVKKIPFVSYDLASDENAKRLWRRKAPLKEQSLPGILVGGKWPGVSIAYSLVYTRSNWPNLQNFTMFEEAVEYGELNQFLRLVRTRTFHPNTTS